jgi:hypothetical protein
MMEIPDYSSELMDFVENNLKDCCDNTNHLYKFLKETIGFSRVESLSNSWSMREDCYKEFWNKFYEKWEENYKEMNCDNIKAMLHICSFKHRMSEIFGKKGPITLEENKKRYIIIYLNYL